MKIWALQSGGSDGDVIVGHVILPDGLNIRAELIEYRAWYRDVYCAKGARVQYQTFQRWLTDRGAREPTPDELEVLEEY